MYIFFLIFQMDSHLDRTHPPTHNWTLFVWEKPFAKMDHPLDNFSSPGLMDDQPLCITLCLSGKLLHSHYFVWEWSCAIHGLSLYLLLYHRLTLAFLVVRNGNHLTQTKSTSHIIPSKMWLSFSFILYFWVCSIQAFTEGMCNRDAHALGHDQDSITLKSFMGIAYLATRYNYMLWYYKWRLS